MAYDFHKDKETYIKWQYENAMNYVIPFIEQKLTISKGLKVLEIGCAEGGVIKAFIDKGCIGSGIELSESRYKRAKKTLAEDLENGMAFLMNKNIYDVDIENDLPHLYDLIVLKDVIEHIPEQEKVMVKLREFLGPNGHIFFGFPPWQMPFGGHQQVAKSKLLSILPYYHLLPRLLYKGVLKAFGEPEKQQEALLEIKDTGISIERFEKIVRQNNYSIQLRKYYLINPIYSYKFGMKVREQFSLIAKIPYLRNFLTSCMYYLVRKED